MSYELPADPNLNSTLDTRYSTVSTRRSVPADLRSALEQALTPASFAALNTAAALARETGVPCYLVGGPVRDLLLGRPVGDLDLVLEGDAISLARRFAEAQGGRLTQHASF